MNETFDPITLIMIAAAVIVFFKLRGVLGQKTGHQDKFDPFEQPKQSPKNASSSEKEEDNVIQMPDRKKKFEESDTSKETAVPENETAISRTLRKISQSDHSFEPDSFLEGAKGAYEMIVTAFADGNKKSLKSLLSKEVYGGFAAAIDNRKSQRVEMTTQFIGIDKADIVNAEIEGRKAFVTVRFVSELVSFVKDKSGAVVEGNETEIQEITDVWTFERGLGSRDPNWRLVATDDDET
jgi:predicted lipid-binding transport protein (Tim44 family)